MRLKKKTYQEAQAPTLALTINSVYGLTLTFQPNRGFEMVIRLISAIPVLFESPKYPLGEIRQCF